MNVKDAFPSKYIKASDLGESKVLVRISHVEQEKVGRDGDVKPVVYFKGKEKGLVLNRTNGKKVAEIQGGSWNSEDWTDLEIGLYATETEFAGDTVECVRVFDPRKGKKPTTPPAAPSKPAVQPAEPEESYENLRDDFRADDGDVPF